MDPGKRGFAPSNSLWLLMQVRQKKLKCPGDPASGGVEIAADVDCFLLITALR